MSGFEGREKDIADAIRAKLDQRGIGKEELKEILESHSQKKNDKASVAGSERHHRKEQYCDAFSNDPFLGPVIGSPEASDIPKGLEEKLGGKKPSTLRSCSQQSVIDCVYQGAFCAYECIHNSVFTPVSYTCQVPNPGDPFHCREDFDCEVDFTCEPDVSFICDDGFECSGLYYIHDYECTQRFECSPPNGTRFMCSKSIDHEGFICGTVYPASFSCDGDEWFSCQGQHNCSVTVTCDTIFHCDEYICGSIHTCPVPGFDCDVY